MKGEPHNPVLRKASYCVSAAIAGLLLCGLAIKLTAATPTRPPAAQIRALWVDGFHPGFRTPQEADQLVADAVAAPLNLLIVQGRRRGDSFYTHSIEPPVEDDPYRPDFDALGYLVEKAHVQGLRAQ